MLWPGIFSYILNLFRLVINHFRPHMFCRYDLYEVKLKNLRREQKIIKRKYPKLAINAKSLDHWSHCVKERYVWDDYFCKHDQGFCTVDTYLRNARASSLSSWVASRQYNFSSAGPSSFASKLIFCFFARQLSEASEQSPWTNDVHFFWKLLHFERNKFFRFSKPIMFCLSVCSVGKHLIFEQNRAVKA